ncbi:AbrB/MazE/SpoVT family DNA-binding domain-containing protein [Palleronia abyssalis]|uniref:SpoVT-AbrB domain-containing protein n=1 Tax=Palleronia abyssalis TaxID=1501240 RepID=A0A2R8C0W8_9RHOB|nr:type II toxin-antitoxin system PrlF family antitoxin [Palleronia abyssalis]SPJ25999.1 hypothetical protein PAA8504_03855 [Palleronia abyssalis]
MMESGVTAKGQTTLPRKVRQLLDLHAGDRVRYVVLDHGEVRVSKLRPVSELAGCLKAPRAVTLDDMDEAIASGASRG